MIYHKHEEVLKVFIEICGTIISFRAESVKFVRYGCLLVDFGERIAGYVVPNYYLGVRWCMNVIHNTLNSSLNGDGSGLLAGVDVSPRCGPVIPYP